MIFSYSVICVYICVWCAPNKKKRNSEILHGIRASFLKPYSLLAASYSGHHSFRPSLSGHLSFRPSLSVINSGKRLSGQSNRRQKTFTAGDFSGDVFFPHCKERLEEISNFSQSIGARKPPTRRPRAFFRPATASHVPAREGM